MFVVRRSIVFQQSRRQFSGSIAWLQACSSCGIKLQSKNPALIGYYTKPKPLEVGKVETLEDVKYMLFSQDIQKIKEIEDGTTLEDEKNRIPHSLICKRCSDAVHQNKYDVMDFKNCSLKEVIRSVPNDKPIVSIASLPEFPFHVNKNILENEKESVLVFTKADQVLKTSSATSTRLPIFFKDYFKYHLGLQVNKVLAVSSLKKWNLSGLLSNLRNNSYFLGNPNVGKSTLMNSLIQRYNGTKLDFNSNISDDMVNDAQHKHLRKAQLAGVSHIPNLTRECQGYQVDKKRIYDLPGYSENVDELPLERIVKSNWLEWVRKTNLFDTKKVKKKPYITIKGTENGRCYTIGGLFFLQPPPYSINQIIKFIPGEPYIFKNVTRALETFKSVYGNDTPHPLEKYCGINDEYCDITKYQRHVIPPFQGSIEIVFKDIGYILLRSTGRYSFNGLYEIWVPKGISVCIREPLEKLIEEGYVQYTESKNKISSCPKGRPLVSSTYIMDPNEEDTFAKIREMYLDRTENEISVRRLVKEDPLEVVSNKHDTPPNLYWHYKW
ncbi:hypothetical protein Kpol_479p12 [Vanderwaltozyma polyspora DSM 70294]|uniref:Genetic interactor of prohibitins 3, mitochondrial n=1 Tax=Vanderwaltozyma polyspora (strain ATCC 22028 / DSM 70294 / BCRC 21397 / CBS 2163 / NBRC 10782 / NRRL Y-8283 / UCD 57-17) TaxID=436907 RepID=GEP3_VANPO|nr:uncharacterized protein Kpol_479p12 [Vanderwaltozyma polyspora DSM 70294]A7TQC5.1 RecName: Full=Genetic interactor of prohibitins 3, mitochondrial; AltName: Full=Found in mitochondrial proteome protein 38; Flags: Precursor [Vanderwaltozyma polyspora DSM 70294]EDO15524.1 hypothetical protein Kpol_479p12 [Vanderwaltozyma polyspora DSM 70294]